jgi:hypothetical protein
VANFYCTVGGSGVGSLGDPFGITQLDTWITTAANAGDVCYIEKGTYAGAYINTARDGAANNPIYLIGVVDITDTLVESLAEADMPYFQGGANDYVLMLDNYWLVRNIKIQSTGASPCFRGDIGSQFWNCIAENLGTGYGIQLGGSGASAIGCKAKSVSGTAMYSAAYSTVANNWLYDSNEGLICLGIAPSITGNVITGCVDGIDLNNQDNAKVLHNTLYDCAQNGIVGGNSQFCTIMFNIFSEMAVLAMDWTGIWEPSNVVDWNCYHNVGGFGVVPVGPNAIQEDPDFVNVAGDDFRVQNANLRDLLLTGLVIGAVPQIDQTYAQGVIDGTATRRATRPGSALERHRRQAPWT